MKKNILLVEDDTANNELLNQILSKDYVVFSATQGLEALDIMNQHKIDLVLSDIKMPKMDGMDLLRALKTINPNIEIILMTAHGSIELAVDAIKKGASDFISKPFRKASLLRSIEKCFERQALLEENQSLKKTLESYKHKQESLEKDYINIPIGTPLNDIERTVIEHTLKKTDGDKKLTAKLLGVGERTIYRKLDEYNSNQ
ncbi:MAG TPA: response regulator [Oligoflexia bacterium]|nr:response regulator [Oligoflexia bacterium]HMR25562.1 response regulator [Oligoflexia bacterium]